MCGIVGIFDTQERREIKATVLTRMNEIQHHRGPDEGALHREPGLAFGHRRLSIIDISTGQQPLFNEDGSVVVVFNGEIYNFIDLMVELQAAGHHFHTRSDTEVIVHAWEEWGAACVERFRGMFAFALWDRNKETLFLARDRLGVKPLHYTLVPDGHFIFSSELKAIAVHPDFRREIDVRAVEDYFAYGYVPEPKTIYMGVLKLPPGHTLTVQRGKCALNPFQYWDISFRPERVVDKQEIISELTYRLQEAVRVRLVSEVPLGAFLSGGVDSSAVVAMMACVSKEQVRTCSISFGDPKFDESHYAAMVSERYHTQHHVDKVEAEDYDFIDILARIYDEPYADSSALPTYRVCQLARKHVTVALSGDGGDETLAGYRRYRWYLYEERLRSLMPMVIRRPLFGFLGNVYPKADWAPRVFRAKTTFEALARNNIEGYFHGVSIMSNAMRTRLFSPDFKRKLQGYQALEVLHQYNESVPDHPLARAQYLDIKTYLVGDILTKVDRASMAHALEVREPLLDHKLMEWCAKLPPQLKLYGKDGKYILKKAMEPYLPYNLLYRPKMGFSLPLSVWFRRPGPLHNRLKKAVAGETLRATGIFNQSYLAEMARRHLSGQRDYSASLWAILMFEAFLKLSLE